MRKIPKNILVRLKLLYENFYKFENYYSYMAHAYYGYPIADAVSGSLIFSHRKLLKRGTIAIALFNFHQPQYTPPSCLLILRIAKLEQFEARKLIKVVNHLENSALPTAGMLLKNLKPKNLLLAKVGFRAGLSSPH